MVALLYKGMSTGLCGEVARCKRHIREGGRAEERNGNLAHPPPVAPKPDRGGVGVDVDGSVGPARGRCGPAVDNVHGRFGRVGFARFRKRRATSISDGDV